MHSTGVCDEVRLAYSNYSTSIITTNLVKAVLKEKLDYTIKMINFPSDQLLWNSIATGKADAMVSAWLPKSNSFMHIKYKNQVDILKPIALGVHIGIVTPTYVTIDRLDQFLSKKNEFNNKIYCIKEHVGSTDMAKTALRVYQLKGVECVVLSEQDIMKKIENNVNKLEWIALASWVPHTMLEKWKLKFLEDPNDAFMKDEKIYAVATKLLKKEHRDVYAFLKEFYCSPKELQELMSDMVKFNKSPYDAAKDYITKHSDKVKKWIKNVKKGHQKRRFHLN
jgi:glycine betaine/proline transport system substrate-binding protein